MCRFLFNNLFTKFHVSFVTSIYSSCNNFALSIFENIRINTVTDHKQAYKCSSHFVVEQNKKMSKPFCTLSIVSLSEQQDVSQ